MATRIVRKKRIRAKIFGTSKRPRLAVFKSNKYIYGQIIDDEKGHTLVSEYGADAKEVGAKLGDEAKKAKIKKVVFDRGGYRYHGRIKSLAEVVREKGLEF